MGKKTNGDLLLTIARGVALNTLCVLALLALTAALTLRGVVGQGSVREAAAVCSALGVLAGSFAAQRWYPAKKLPLTMAGCGGYLALLVLLNLLFSGSRFAGVWGIALPALLGSSLAAMLGSRPKRRAYRRR